MIPGKDSAVGYIWSQKVGISLGILVSMAQTSVSVIVSLYRLFDPFLYFLCVDGTRPKELKEHVQKEAEQSADRCLRDIRNTPKIRLFIDNRHKELFWLKQKPYIWSHES